MIERLTRGYGKAALVSLFYFTCSISMNFLNKAVVSSYDFNYTLLHHCVPNADL